jgi:hypothetical protein
MEKQRAAFPHPANSVAHSSIRRGVIHIAHNAEGGEIPLTPSCLVIKTINEQIQKIAQ